MIKEQPGKTSVGKPVRILLILLLSAIGCTALPLQGVADIPGFLEKGLKEVSFSGEKDMEALAQTYPFINKDIQRVRDRDAGAKESSPPPRIRIAEFPDKKASLFFMFFDGYPYCSSHGCPLYVYADEDGTGYKKAFETVTYESIHFIRDYHGSKVSLFLPTKQSYARWDLKDHSFEHFVAPDAGDLPRDEQGRFVDKEGNLIEDEHGVLLPPGQYRDKEGHIRHYKKDRTHDDSGRHLGQDKEHDNNSGKNQDKSGNAKKNHETGRPIKDKKGNFLIDKNGVFLPEGKYRDKEGRIRDYKDSE